MKRDGRRGSKPAGCARVLVGLRLAALGVNLGGGSSFPKSTGNASGFFVLEFLNSAALDQKF